MSVSIVAQVDLRQVDQMLSAMETNLRSSAVPELVGEIVRSDILRQFQIGGEPAWAPLSPRTIAEKTRIGYPRLTRRGVAPRLLMQRGVFGPQNILERTGALLSSYTQADDPNHIERMNGDTLTIGSSLPYAIYHQTGGRRLPRRAVAITPEALAAAVAEVPKRIMEAS